MSDDLRRRMDRLAREAPHPGERREDTLRDARRGARRGLALAGAVSVVGVLAAVLAIGAVLGRPSTPVPAVVPAPTGTAVAPPSEGPGLPARPTGTVAFWSDVPAGGRSLLTVIGATGSDRTIARPGGISTSRLSLAPDGGAAVYDRGLREGAGQLEVVDLGTGAIDPIVTDGNPQSPDWSPDGDRIVFHDERAGLFTVPAIGGEPRPVTAAGSDGAVRGSWPTWSPRGDRIASIDPTQGTIRIARTDGRGPLATLPVAGRVRSLDWGATGIVASIVPSQGGPASLALVDPDTGSVRALAVSPADGPGDPGDPAVSPDGRFAAFVGTVGGQRDLFVLRVGDGRVWRLTDDPRQDFSPAWFPGS